MIVSASHKTVQTNILDKLISDVVLKILLEFCLDVFLESKIIKGSNFLDQLYSN